MIFAGTTLAQSLFRDEILKLVNNYDYSDIVLKIANESYPAHRIVIKYRSPKLHGIIQQVRPPYKNLTF